MSRSSMEKHDHTTENVEKASTGGIDQDERITSFTHKEQRAIVRKIDIRLVLTLGVMYCISLLDRTNLGAASVAGFVDPSTNALNSLH